MEAFAKSDDEREFYLDRVEGYIIYVDLNKAGEELDLLNKELEQNPDRCVPIPRLSFYEAKKIMEGFVNEKVYDIDTKEKLLDIISSKEARENFLDFVYDHHAELEKWQQYYQERSRIRIIEWLRKHNFHFVFEEDLDIAKATMERLKETLFQAKVSNDIVVARKILSTKAKSYYSSEALNPRPKRGRPPKMQVKQEIEPQITIDLYTQVPSAVRPFLFTPQINSAADVTFSATFSSEEELLNQRRNQAISGAEEAMESLNKKLASLRSLSSGIIEQAAAKKPEKAASKTKTKARSTTAKKTSSTKKTTTTAQKKPLNRVRPLPAKKTTTTKKATTAASKKRLRPLKKVKKD